MKLTMLGTGNALVTECYNTCFVIEDEAFCLYSERDIFDPYEKHHSTVKDACELAEKLHVKNLLLYHTEDKNLHDRKYLYMNEGSKYYGGNIFVPDDLESLDL